MLGEYGRDATKGRPPETCAGKALLSLARYKGGEHGPNTRMTDTHRTHYAQHIISSCIRSR